LVIVGCQVNIGELNHKLRINKDKNSQRKRFNNGKIDEKRSYLNNNKNKGNITINIILLVTVKPATNKIKLMSRIIGCKISCQLSIVEEIRFLPEIGFFV
jgi:hypothetical protein